MKNNFTLIIFCLLFNSTQIFTQDSIRIIAPMAHGSYKIEINGEEYRAITPETMKKLLGLQVLLDANTKELAAKDSLLAAYAETDYWYNTLVEQHKNYISGLESVLEGYKGLVKDYKRLKAPWLTVQGGVGVSGHDTKPAVLFGLGIRDFRVWGLFQERNSGVLLGGNLNVW
jgi:hypothetical protein